MNSAHSSSDKKIEFLKNEYDFLSDYMKYKYDERDKYIKFYIGALTAVGAIIGHAINKDKWEVVFILAAMTSIFSYFILMKLVSQRKVATEYKNHLNMVRGELLEVSGGGVKIKSKILSTVADIKFYKKSGGDFSIMLIIIVILAISTFWTALLLLSDDKLNWIQLGYKWRWIFSLRWIISLVASILISVWIFEIKWKKVLQNEDKKYSCDVCKYFDKDTKTCSAYPDRIPTDILNGENRHLYSRNDQKNDIIFLKRPEPKSPKALASRN